MIFFLLKQVVFNRKVLHTDNGIQRLDDLTFLGSTSVEGLEVTVDLTLAAVNLLLSI